ncbi:hypothetical protein BC826DRAFT_410512 [Russula brevipes]|nr:hypothetical protein BC826DRAFT_410512 [Russula brevipes]
MEEHILRASFHCPCYSPDSPPTGHVKPSRASVLTSHGRNSDATSSDYSNLPHNLRPAPSELPRPDARLPYMKTPSAHGCAGPDSVAYCVVPFPSTNASPPETTGKAAPIVVSATSIRVKFREAEPPTIPSEGLDKQSTHGTTATLQVNDGLPAAPGAHVDTHISTAIYPSPEVAKATPGHPRSTEPLLREELHTVASSLPYDTDSSTRQVPTSKLADKGAAPMITSTTSAIHKQVMGTTHPRYRAWGIQRCGP